MNGKGYRKNCFISSDSVKSEKVLDFSIINLIKCRHEEVSSRGETSPYFCELIHRSKKPPYRGYCTAVFLTLSSPIKTVTSKVRPAIQIEAFSYLVMASSSPGEAAV